MTVQRFLINKILLYHSCHELKKQLAEINAQKEEGGGALLVPLRVFSLKRSKGGASKVPFKDLRGEKKFKPRPQNRILVPLRVSL